MKIKKVHWDQNIFIPKPSERLTIYRNLPYHSDCGALPVLIAHVQRPTSGVHAQ